MRRIALPLALALLALPLAAQPALRNARIVAARAAGALGAPIRGASTTWVAYSVESAEDDAVICCMDSGWKQLRACRLDGSNWGSFNIGRNGGDRDELTVSSQVLVFYRVSNKVIDRVRIFSSNCPIDAHDTSIAWIDGVDPKQSVRFLQSLVKDDGEKVGKRSVDALALHAEESATAALETLMNSSMSTEMRGHAAFWLGNARGRRGYLAVKRLANDPNESTRLREKAVFAMTQSEQPERTDDLIAIARRDPEGKMRSQALFWLSQAAGKKAAAALRDAVDNDPDEEVKKKAVFGISQLPDDQSIPLLADLLRTHKSPGVRKQAAFWLGQKKDSRALDILEEILRK